MQVGLTNEEQLVSMVRPSHRTGQVDSLKPGLFELVVGFIAEYQLIETMNGFSVGYRVNRWF